MAETHVFAARLRARGRLRAGAAYVLDRSRTTGAALALVVAASAALRGYWAARVPTPWINGDETIYAELGRSLWQSGHFEILGSPTRFYTFVYPALVGGPLSLHDAAFGYELLKWVQGLVMSLAAIPVYLWGRTLTTRRWALAAAVLTLALPGLAYSGLVMTEVAFYPVFVVAAWLMARSVQTPTLARQAVALGAIGFAVVTRLQALVLAPAYVMAIVLALLLGREPLRAVRAYLPTAAGLVALGAGWTAWQRSSGSGGASDVLGAYRAAGEANYAVGTAAKFVAYHAADVVLLTGIVPVAAVLLLLGAAVSGREQSPATRAYLAVTIAVTTWLVVEVGVFASQIVGTLAERNLFAVAPLFFLGLAVWLGRGAPAAPALLVGIVLGAVGLVAALPLGTLLTDASQWDAFTLLPLYDLRQVDHSVDPRLVAVGPVAAVAALPAFVSRRRLWLVPVILVVAFAALSAEATRTVLSESSRTRSLLIGHGNTTWVDAAAPRGPVAFVTGGEALWTAVYEHVFWNRKLDRVYTLPGFAVPGPLPQSPVGPRTDGLMVYARGNPARARFVLASNRLTFVGKEVATRDRAKLVLWRVRQPLRLSTWVTGMSIVERSSNERGDLSVLGGIGSDATLVAYDCSGTFKLKLVARGVRTAVAIRRDRAVVRRGTMGPWRALHATVPARARRAGAACELEITSSSTIDARLELTRA